MPRGFCMNACFGAAVLFACLAGGVASLSTSQPASKAEARPGPLPPPPADAAAIAEFPGLHNVVTYTEGIYSGSVPYGDAGFDSLKALGVRTILSVDGAAPEVQFAEARGMRYVHLPITYAGMSDQRRLEITRAIRDLPHPMYVHCHHGKHRSAAAVGSAAVALGLLTPEQAEGRMKVSGTAPGYTGLWKCVATSTVMSAAEIDAADASFPPRYKTTGMVQSMVEIDEASDHLKQIEAAGWTTPKDHPDLVPAAEAGRMADLLRVLVKDPEVSEHPAEFATWLTESATMSTALEEALVRGQSAAELSAKFKLISKACKDCHVKYRD